MKIISAAITIIIILLNSNLYAQVSFYLSTDQEYNDNPFRSTEPTKSLISSLDGGIEYDFTDFAMGYYGSFINFDAARDRNFYWHQFAVWKNFESSSLAVYAEQRLNRSDYTYFDYTSFNAYYQLRFNIEDFYFGLSPNFSLTRYDNISILDNYKISLGYYINRGFETGTTLILGGGFNYKKYLDPTQSGTYFYFDETNNLIEEAYTDQNINSLTQIVTYGRIAQSITPTTGAAFQFTNRSIINGIANQIKDLNMVYGDESEIFDDPVNHEGNGFAFELTQILFNDITIKAGYYLNNKYYPSQGIYGIDYYDTGIMRADKQQILNLSIKKTVSPALFDTMNLQLGLDFQLIDNKSNSYWFNYEGKSINLSLGFQF